MNIGVVGLGRMGAGVAGRLVVAGNTVVVYNRTFAKTAPLVELGAQAGETIKEFIEKIPQPRVVLLYLPSGEVTKEHIQEIVPLMESGDILLDGGNSYYKDSLETAKLCEEAGIDFMDVGTSGGVAGAVVGYCLMIGGEVSHFERLQPLWKSIAQPDAVVLTGPVGSGHYTKMVHNAIEYGMLQAYGEGMQILAEGKFAGQLHLPEITETWQHGSIIRSYLGELLAQSYQNPGLIAQVPGVIGQNGEGRWCADEAKELGIDVPVLEASLEARSVSQHKQSYSSKIVAILRNFFGGHAL